jgi:hypothetical protein
MQDMKLYCTFHPYLMKNTRNTNDENTDQARTNDMRPMSARGRDKSESLFKGAAKIAQKRTELGKLSPIYEMRGCTFSP